MDNRKGIWIPRNILKNKQLDWPNKVLLSEIYSLHEQEKGCIASNKHFGELLGITDSAASRRITKLKEWKYITTKNVYENRRCLGRKIIPLKQQHNTADNNNTSKEKEVDIENQIKGTSHRNDTVVPEEQYGTSQTTNGVLPGQQGSTSSTTRGVLPGQQGSTCQKNTNNTRNNTTNNNTDINTTGIKHGPIQDIDKIVEGSSFFSQLFKNNPVAITKFKNSCKEALNNSNEPIQTICSKMNYYLSYDASWKKDLLEIGPESLIEKFYHSKRPDASALGLVYGYAYKIFQHEKK